MKGLFIPEITAEMLRNGCLESIEALMAEGEIYDIDYQQPSEDCISRKEVLDYLDKMPSELTSDGRRMVRRRTLEEYISDTLLSVTPQQTRWIPIKTRPMTEEEKEHFSEYADSRCDDNYTMLDCPLPDDGQEVIVSSNGYVGTDIFCRDSADGCYFEGYDIDDVDAWMSLPQPYTESEDKE